MYYHQKLRIIVVFVTLNSVFYIHRGSRSAFTGSAMLYRHVSTLVRKRTNQALSLKRAFCIFRSPCRKGWGEEWKLFAIYTPDARHYKEEPNHLQHLNFKKCVTPEMATVIPPLSLKSQSSALSQPNQEIYQPFVVVFFVVFFCIDGSAGLRFTTVSADLVRLQMDFWHRSKRKIWH